MVSIIVDRNVPVPMRDGVVLRADVYRPAEPGHYPVALCRTPYSKDAIQPTAQSIRLAEAGYVVVVQDVRGRWTSDGAFNYMAQMLDEGPDGFDTIEWAAALPYSSGKVVTYGLSYLGQVQWMAAFERPPHLTAIAPTQITVDGTQGLSHRGGALEYGLCLRWSLSVALSEVARQARLRGGTPQAALAAVRETAAELDRLCDDGFRQVPLVRLPLLEKIGLAGVLENTISWGPGHHRAETLARRAEVRLPALCTAGWYDCFQQGSLDDYVALRANGSPARLLVGPWGHGTGLLTSAIGDVDFGAASSAASLEMAGDLTTLHIRWFDRWLKEIDNGLDREPPVRLFVMGEDRWTSLPDWPPPSVERKLFLHGDGLASFDSPSAGTRPRAYVYDPLDPAPTLGGNTLLPGNYPWGVRDQRPLSSRSDVLTFVGETVERPLTIAGRISASLCVSSTAPDTDFVARLIDVHPDGFMRNLCDGIQRGRYRETLDAPAWFQPRVPTRLSVDLWSTVHVVLPGHRLAVQVTSSSFPRWDSHWNTTEDPARATGGGPAMQTLFTDAERASYVALPVVEGGLP